MGFHLLSAVFIACANIGNRNPSLYSTCIFCHSSLGKNEAVEHFPVGRRLAFDGEKGRLWVVCGKCGRWNLTPLEERWEAVEECERQYRETIKRSTTDQIGLGRVKEGTDLIRIGKPLRPEFAAWRYGRFFKRRRRNSQIAIGAGLATYAITFGVAGPAFAIVPQVVGLLIGAMKLRSDAGRARRLIADKAGVALSRKIWKAHGVGVRIIPSDHEQGWGLRFAHDGKFVDYHGPEALHTSGLIAPALNKTGGSPREVDVAVRDIEIAGSPEAYFKRVLKFGQDQHWHYTGLDEYPEHMRLAFEMAAHEETERAAVEGELTQLEADWREAEEIAAIADNLFVPKSITEFIERNR